jgi:hypothetical protein
VVNIEIVERRPMTQARRYHLDTATLWSLALLLLTSLAHAQPTYWDSYQRGSTTYYSGTDANGMRFFEFTGPDGQTQHCRSYELPGARHAESFP